MAYIFREKFRKSHNLIPRDNRINPSEKCLTPVDWKDGSEVTTRGLKKPKADSVKPGPDSVKPGPDSVKPGPDSIKPKTVSVGQTGKWRQLLLAGSGIVAGLTALLVVLALTLSGE